MRNGVRPGWWCLVAGLAYGALLTLAWPPVDVWWLAFATPLPLVMIAEFIARKGTSARRAGTLTALGSLPFWFLQTRWLLDVTPAGYPCLAIYMSVYAGLFVALLARLRRARPSWDLWMVTGPLWVGLEVVRGEFMLTGYPWFLAGHPLVEFPILAAPAAILGAYFVSLLVVTLAASAAQLLGALPGGARSGQRSEPQMIDVTGSAPSRHPERIRARRRAAVAAAVTLGVWAGTALLARSGEGPGAGTIRAAVIQTNLPQSNKLGWPLRNRIDDFTHWLELTAAGVTQDPSGIRPDVVIWPETMFPGDALNPEAVEVLTASGLVWPASMLGPEATRSVPCDAFALELVRVQRELGVPIVTGALAIDGLRVERKNDKLSLGYDAKYNSALVVESGRINPQRYDKHSLTPFGEAIPYAWRVPAIQQALLSIGAGGMSFDLAWGTRAGPLVVPVAPDANRPEAVRFATPICFEVVRSNLCRRLVHEGEDSRTPVVLVNLSNDGWFTRWPEGRAQHFQIARWRCVELGVAMVRSVNTGISGVIDARGRVLAKGIPQPHGEPIEVGVDGVLTVDVPLARASSTPFSRWFGNAAGYGCLVAAVALILAGRRRSTPAPPPPSDAAGASARTAPP